MDPNARDLRERLFAISDFDRMEMLNKMGGLPPEVLATHPELMTWEGIRFAMTADPPRHRHDRRPRWRQQGPGGRRRSRGRSRPEGGAGICQHLHGSNNRNRDNDRN